MIRFCRLLIAGLLIIISGLIILSPKVTHATSASFFDNAKNQACQGANVTSGSACDANAGKSLNNIITNVINIFSVIIGMVAVVMIIVAGVKFMTSSGDATKVSGARNTILYAVVGLIVVAFAQSIVHFVLTKTPVP
jgi:Type IV secretion system pilin